MSGNNLKRIVQSQGLYVQKCDEDLKQNPFTLFIGCLGSKCPPILCPQKSDWKILDKLTRVRGVII